MKGNYARAKDHGRWCIGNGSFALEVAVGEEGWPVIDGLRLASAREVTWASPSRPFAPVVVAGGVEISAAAGTLRFLRGEILPDVCELVLSFSTERELFVDLHLAPAKILPVWRSWTVLRNASAEPMGGITRFDAANMVVGVGQSEPQASYILGWMEGPRADVPGRHSIPWAYGGWIPKFLYGEGTVLPPPPPGGWSAPSLRVMRERLARLPLRSGKRSTYENHPWVSVLDPERAGGFFIGFEWAGTWRMDLEHLPETHEVTAFAASDGCVHVLPPGGTLESPAAFIGLFQGDWDDASNACRRYVGSDILSTKAFPWPQSIHCYFFHNFPGQRDQSFMRREIDAAAAMGFELTNVEPVWWSESSAAYPPPDFSHGLGDFADHREKFPGGLRAMSDYVRSRGMGFGLWFEIERVDIRTCNRLRNPWKPEWVVHQNGHAYRSWCQHVFMLCLGVKDAAEWALENLLWAVKEYGIDYIMFDSNEWAVCDDPTHDHGPGDGEWAQIHGYLHVMRELRRACPELMIQNSSGGSQRADFAIARSSTHVHPHDTQAPSSRERRYLYGMGSMYPSGYQAQAVGNYSALPRADRATRPWEVYSYQPMGPITVDVKRWEWRILNRLLGCFAMGHEAAGMQPEHAALTARAMAFYKRIRATLNDDRYVLIPPRVLDDPECLESDNWEAYQHVSRTGKQALLHVYRCLSTEPKCTVRLRGLDSDARYNVESFQEVPIRTLTGRTLMERGFTCALPTTRSADIFIFSKL